jgi:hypothetical protein
MTPLARRQFLKTSAVAGAAAAVSGCSAFANKSTVAPQPVNSTPETVETLPMINTPEAVKTQPGITTPEPVKTQPVINTPTAVKPQLVKIYPEALKSVVVHTHHSGVWAGDTLQPAVLTQMLDASITKLTGMDDPLKGWQALFLPTEKIAIKINTIAGSITGTHPAFLAAVLERLKAAGMPDEQIFVYDRDSWEIDYAGFTVNKNSPGIILRGTDGDYAEGFKVMNKDVRLSNFLLKCDALINLPILKQHMYAGVSFSMKNHYGTFDSPANFHSTEQVKTGLPELNALAPVKDKTRLIIGDALDVVLGDEWTEKVTGDSIFMSFDPVAHDLNGFNLWRDTVKGQAKDDSFVQWYADKANSWLTHATELGLGTCDPAHIELIDQKLG